MIYYEKKILVKFSKVQRFKTRKARRNPKEGVLGGGPTL